MPSEKSSDKDLGPEAEKLATAIAAYLADITPREQWPQDEETLYADFHDVLPDIWDIALKRMSKVTRNRLSTDEYPGKKVPLYATETPAAE